MPKVVWWSWLHVAGSHRFVGNVTHGIAYAKHSRASFLNAYCPTFSLWLRSHTISESQTSRKRTSKTLLSGIDSTWLRAISDSELMALHTQSIDKHNIFYGFGKMRRCTPHLSFISGRIFGKFQIWPQTSFYATSVFSMAIYGFIHDLRAYMTILSLTHIVRENFEKTTFYILKYALKSAPIYILWKSRPHAFTKGGALPTYREVREALFDFEQPT